MLRQSIERCPDDIWISGDHPRNFWRIAYHGVFYAHLYLMPNEAAFQPWEKHNEGVTDLWPEANPEVVEPYSRQELMEYVDRIGVLVDPTIDAMDLDSEDSGFSWYPNFGKLDHLILSIRHTQGHIGQLSELLMMHGIDTQWMGKR